MFGLLLVVVTYLILGFFYAWIAGIVAREEVSVKVGAVVVLIPGIVRFVLAVSDIDVGLLGLLIDYALLALGSKYIAHLEWKYSLIVAAVYTALLLAIGLALVFMFSS
ncbi:MAG: hypothetical protein R3B57_09015 [Phycisphaerales bacterium]